MTKPDFVPRGHPQGKDLTSTQKMLYLRIENIYLDLSRELSEYLAYNHDAAAALEALHKSREYALKSVMSDDIRVPGGGTATKSEPLRADGFPVLGKKPTHKPPEVKNEKKEEIDQQELTEAVVEGSAEVSKKKRGRPKKEQAAAKA